MAWEVTNDNFKLISPQLRVEKEEGHLLSSSQHPYYTFHGKGHVPNSIWCIHHYCYHYGMENSHLPDWGIYLLILIDRLTQTLCRWRVPSKEGMLGKHSVLCHCRGKVVTPYRELFQERNGQIKRQKLHITGSSGQWPNESEFAPKYITFQNM